MRRECLTVTAITANNLGITLYSPAFSMSSPGTCFADSAELSIALRRGIVRGLKSPITKQAALLLLCALALVSCQRASRWRGDQKLIILGVDGLDPQLLKQY